MKSNRSIWRKIGRGLKTLLLGFFPLILMLALVLRGAQQETSTASAHLPDAAPTSAPQAYSEIRFSFGRGYIGDGWRLYFSEPDASADRESYQGGIEMALVEAILRTRESSMSPLLK